MIAPRTRYARSRGASIAYHVVGDGPVNLVYAPGPASQVELLWQEPVTARYLHRIASFARLVMFDRRGTGLSDPVDSPPTLEQQMDDVQAVIHAAGMQRTSLFGVSDSGLCALYAATHPDEVTSVVLWGVAASGAQAVTREYRNAILTLVEDGWGSGGLLPFYAPSRVGDQRFAAWFAHYERAAVSPGMARRLLEFAMQVDIRDVLPTIGVPTLVLTAEAMPSSRSISAAPSHSASPMFPSSSFPGLTTIRGAATWRAGSDSFATSSPAASVYVESPIECCPPSCLPTSSNRRIGLRSSETSAGTSCSTSTT